MSGFRRFLGFLLTAAVAAALVTLVPVGTSPVSAQTDATDHVQAFGGVPHLGSLDTLLSAGVAVADAGVVTLIPTPSGSGYWIVTADGSVFSFGDAAFFGSVGTLRAAGVPIDPSLVIVGAVPTPSGSGYWLADEVGGVFGFGDAAFFGSIPALRGAGVGVGAAGVVAMGPSPTGNGYWLVDEVGGVFGFGDAAFFGSGAPDRLSEPVVAFAATAAGDGYRLLNADGRVRSYGNAPDHGSATIDVSRSALALASAASGTGYWVAGGHDRPAAAPPLPLGSGAGRRVVYSNSRQRIWLVERTGVVSASWPVSGRRGIPAPGSYRVFSKSLTSTDASGSLVLRNMVRFAHGRDLAIGFHAIPTRNGRPIQGTDELGQYRSAGCVRQAPGDAQHLYAWAPVGTTVVVTP